MSTELQSTFFNAIDPKEHDAPLVEKLEGSHLEDPYLSAIIRLHKLHEELHGIDHKQTDTNNPPDQLLTAIENVLSDPNADLTDIDHITNPAERYEAIESNADILQTTIIEFVKKCRRALPKTKEDKSAENNLLDEIEKIFSKIHAEPVTHRNNDLSLVAE